MAMPSHNQLLFNQVGGSIMGCSFFKMFFTFVGLNRQVVLALNFGS
jgi:hypothetical protein